MKDPENGCSCLYTTPCQDMCTCVHSHSSRGCRRCCRYGSVEQRTTMAEYLAKFIDAGWKEYKENTSAKMVKNSEVSND